METANGYLTKIEKSLLVVLVFLVLVITWLPKINLDLSGFVEVSEPGLWTEMYDRGSWFLDTVRETRISDELLDKQFNMVADSLEKHLNEVKTFADLEYFYHRALFLKFYKTIIKTKEEEIVNCKRDGIDGGIVKISENLIQDYKSLFYESYKM